MSWIKIILCNIFDRSLKIFPLDHLLFQLPLTTVFPPISTNHPITTNPIALSITQYPQIPLPFKEYTKNKKFPKKIVPDFIIA
jgi:hypothetical protein